MESSASNVMAQLIQGFLGESDAILSKMNFPGQMAADDPLGNGRIK